MTTPANPDDLIAWLRAIYDEREQVARKAAAVCGCHTPSTGWLFDDESTDGRILVAADPHPEQRRRLGRRWNGTYDGLFMAQHIADNDPAYVLADVDAKRRILDLHPHLRFATLPEEWPDHWKAEIKQAFPGSEQPYVGCEVDDFNSDYEVVEPGWWCQTVRLLALPHAGRDGYRPEWSTRDLG